MGPSKVLARAWSDLAQRWNDTRLHERFLELALDQDELPAACRLYDIWLAYLPKDPWGRRGRAELTMLCAIASAEQQQRKGPLRPLLFVLASLLVVGGTLVARFG